MCLYYITGFLLLIATDVQNSRSSFQFPCRVVYQVKTSWRGWFSRNAPFERGWGNLIDEIYNDVVHVIHVCIYVLVSFFSSPVFRNAAQVVIFYFYLLYHSKVSNHHLTRLVSFLLIQVSIDKMSLVLVSASWK